MTISDWSVNAYLVFFIVSAAVNLLGGLYLSIMGRQHPLDIKIVLRGIWSIAIASGLLALFRMKTVENGLAVLIAYGMLYFVGEGIVYLIGKSRGRLEPVQTEESKRENWEKVRARGKLRFATRFVLLFSYGGLWFAVSLKIIFWDDITIFIPIAVVLASAIWGYIESRKWWKKNSVAFKGSTENCK